MNSRTLVPAAALSVLLLGAAAPPAAGTPSSEAPSEPPAPSVSSAVQNLLDVVEESVKDNDMERALSAAEKAIQQARAESDIPGEALGYKAKAQVLETQYQFEDALTTWLATRDAWQRAGDGPGVIEAVLAEARCGKRQPEYDSNSLLGQAISMVNEEQRRPIAAAGVLTTAGAKLLELKQLEEAKRLAEAALSRFEVIAPNSLYHAACLRLLGSVIAAQGDRKSAREYLLRALAIQNTTVPGSVEVAATTEKLARLTLVEKDLAGARQYYERALAIREESAPESIDTAKCLTDLGQVLLFLRDWVGAGERFERALRITESVEHSDSIGVAHCLNNLAIAAGLQDDIASSRQYLERSLRIMESRTPGSPHIASALSNLGIVASIQSDLAGAREYYSRALDLQLAQHPTPPEVSNTLGNLAGLARSQGDLLGAREYNQRALAVSKSRGESGSIDAGIYLTRLAEVASDHGDFTSAEDYLDQAAELIAAKPRDSVESVNLLINRGRVARSQGDSARSGVYLQRALEVERAKNPGSVGEAHILVDLGAIAASSGDHSAAREYLTPALSILEYKRPNSFELAAALASSGNVDRAAGDVPSARAQLQRAWGIVRKQASDLAGDQAQQSYWSRYDDVPQGLMREQLAEGDVTSAISTLEESRAQGLLRMLALRGIENRLGDTTLWSAYRAAEKSFQGASKRLAEASTILERVQADLKSASLASAGARDLMAKRESLTKAESDRELALSEYTRLRLEMEGKLAGVQAALPALRTDPVNLTEARSVLPSDSLWVAISMGEHDVVMLLIPADPEVDVAAYVVSIDRADLTAKVASILNQVRSHPPSAKAARRAVERNLATAGRELYALLFPADARVLVDKASELLISPDGILWELPFSLLVSNQDGEPRWLGLEKPMSYQQSLSAYVREGRRGRSENEGVLIVGNPAFDASTVAKSGRSQRVKPTRGKEDLVTERPLASGTGWTRGERSYFVEDGRSPSTLPGSELEAKEVAALFAVEPLTGAAATEAAVRSRIPDARVIHLATHGYFHSTMPMASGVLLAAPANEPAVGQTDDDGVLQAFEFSGKLKLDADLVVLSACETGRGQTVRGEGLVGLTRSLQVDGAQSVVATRWRIDDRASTELMVSFHRKMKTGQAIALALQHAMVETRAKARSREPYFWASFFLTGQRWPIAP